MIRFACHCGFDFEVPQDLAGGEIQCPQCGKLNDVPTLSDINNLDQGGIFKMTDAPAPMPSRLLAEAQRAYTFKKQEEKVNDIDMRATVDEYLAAGVDEIPLSTEDEALPGAPK